MQRHVHGHTNTRREVLPGENSSRALQGQSVYKDEEPEEELGSFEGCLKPGKFGPQRLKVETWWPQRKPNSHWGEGSVVGTEKVRQRILKGGKQSDLYLKIRKIRSFGQSEAV